jgi:hypothetical protein
MVYLEDADVIDFLFKPVYMLCDIMREVLFLLYIALGLIFLVFLVEREFPEFRAFCGSALKQLALK